MDAAGAGVVCLKNEPRCFSPFFSLNTRADILSLLCSYQLHASRRGHSPIMYSQSSSPDLDDGVASMT